jgi:hypothetical protein
MTRLLLHIGHPKTGTTALQSVLSANAKKLLAEASILYPTRTTPSEYKHAFAIPWLLQADNESIRRRARKDGEELKELSKGYWDSLIREVNEEKPDILILSAEGFWSILRRVPENQRSFFRDRLYETASKIKTIAYLKSPTSYFLSKINQKIRNFRPVTLPRHNYISSAIRDWESLGLDEYCWRVFDRRSLCNRDIVDDFFDQNFPTSISPSTLSREGVEQSNSSISTEALVLLEEITTEHKALSEDVYDRRRSKIISILRAADAAISENARPSLTEQAKQGILARCSDINWLNERGLYFPDIDLSSIKEHHAFYVPDTFTRVADFCPINQERLRIMRTETAERISNLFRSTTPRIFWSFKSLRHRT